MHVAFSMGAISDLNVSRRQLQSKLQLHAVRPAVCGLDSERVSMLGFMQACTSLGDAASAAGVTSLVGAITTAAPALEVRPLPNMFNVRRHWCCARAMDTLSPYDNNNLRKP